MKANIIQPGIGMGKIRFGMLEDEVRNILGEPSGSEHREYIDGYGNWYKELTYDELNLELTFNKEDGYKLGCISVTGPGYYLLENDLFGKSIEFVKTLCKKVTKQQLILEDYTIQEGEPHECLNCDELEILFWFDCGKLSEIQFSYFFEEDGNTVIWPE